MARRAPRILKAMATSTLRDDPGLDTATSTALDINSLWDVMNELYDVRTNWKMIGLGLRLPHSDLEAMSGSPQECLERSMSKWLKGIDPVPTWQAIVAVLRSPLLDEKKKAKELEDKFYCDIPSETRMKVTRTQPETTDSSVGSLESAMTPNSDGSNQAFQLCPKSMPFEAGASSVAESNAEDGARVEDSSPSSPAKPSLLHYVERVTDAEVKKKVKRKDNRFRTLVRKTHHHISRTITTRQGIADFRVAISYLPASLHNHHILLSPDDRTAIMEAKSFDQIFVVLNQYWTFVQYELLEYVVQEYGNARLKKEMKAYIADMDELESQIGLDHFTDVRRCFPRPDSVALNIHLTGSQHKLCDARNVQRSMAEQNGLHPFAVRTLQNTPGSTILTLLVPYAVAGHVVASLHGMQPAVDLLSRPVKERVVYTMDETETEMYLPQNVEVHLAAQLPMPAADTGRRERRGSGDSSHSASTGYETLSRVSEDPLGVVGESDSQIAVLTSVIRKKDRQVEELQQKLEDSTLTQPPGKPSKDGRAVFILGSVAPHSNKSVVQQSPATLSDDDRQVLTELGLPPDKWDNLNVLLAMYNRAEPYDVFSVQVSKPGVELSRSYVLEQIKYLLINSVQKEGATIHYYGNGRRNTGDWCFRDGFITFRDIADLYMKHGRGQVLCLVPDCHSSGHWVVECAKFLDEQGVRPCGHSAGQKGILLKVYTACKTGQDTAELCYNTRAMKVKSDGLVYHWISKELSEQQNSVGVNFTEVRCGKGGEEACAVASDSTWSTVSKVTSGRLYLTRAMDKSRPGWYYILLDDDPEKIKQYKHKTQGENAGKGSICPEEYGTVLRSGWGEDPSQEDRDWLEERMQDLEAHSKTCFSPQASPARSRTKKMSAPSPSTSPPKQYEMPTDHLIISITRSLPGTTDLSSLGSPDYNLSSFKIVTKTNLPQFPATLLEVNRSQSDFQWLYNALQDACPERIVPPLKPPISLEITMSEFQRFLCRLAAHKTLCRHHLFIVFLSGKSEEMMSVKAKYRPPRHGDQVQYKPAVGRDTNSGPLVATKEYLTTLQQNLLGLASHLEQSIRMKTSSERTAHWFRAISECEPGETYLKKAACDLARTCDTMENSHGDSEDTLLTHSFQSIADYVGTALDLLLRVEDAVDRFLYWDKEITLIEAVSTEPSSAPDQRAKADSLTINTVYDDSGVSDVTSSSEQSAGHLTDVTTDVTDHMTGNEASADEASSSEKWALAFKYCGDAKDYLEMMCRDLSIELNQFDLQKELELKHILMDYAARQLERHEKCQGKWFAMRFLLDAVVVPGNRAVELSKQQSSSHGQPHYH